MTIEKDGTQLTLDYKEIQHIFREYSHEVYFREDVRSEIEDRVDYSGWPEKLLNDKKFEADALARYIEIRKREDSDPEGLGWNRCVNMALDELYSEFCSK